MDGCVWEINRELQSRGDGGKVLRNTFSLPLRSHLSRNLVISMVLWLESPGPGPCLCAAPGPQWYLGFGGLSPSQWNRVKAAAG